MKLLAPFLAVPLIASLALAAAAQQPSITSGPIVQQAYLKAPAPDSSDFMGDSIAMSGNTLVIGAYGDDTDGAGPLERDTGAAMVFLRTGSTWTFEAYLKASNADINDRFGKAVAIDGDTIVIGATAEDSSATGVNGNQADNGTIDSGAVYVFVRSAGVWTQQAYLKATAPDYDDKFGSAVAISGDTLVVGSPSDDSASVGIGGDPFDNGLSYSGAVYVFTRTGTSWASTSYVKELAPNSGGGFGGALSIDGDTFVAGANWRALVFERSGTAWSQTATLMGIGADAMGSSVAVWGDTIAVGAPGGNPGTPEEGGNVYVFHKSGSTWPKEISLKSGYAELGDGFGLAVGLAGNVLVVGSEGEDSAAKGIDGDETDNSAKASGAAHIFIRENPGWTKAAYLKASNTDAGDKFGHAVAATQEMVAVGAPYEYGGSPGVNGSEWDNSVGAAGAGYAFDVPIDCNMNGIHDSQDIASGASMDCDGNGIPDECDLLLPFADVDNNGILDVCLTPALSADVYELSVAAGGQQNFSLESPFALDVYLLLGTTSGTSPGIQTGSFTVPLNVDSYLIQTAIAPNQAPLSGSFGVLLPSFPGPGATASATFTLPAALDPSLVGLTIHHAFVTLDFLTSATSSVSNSIPLTLLP